MAQILKDIADTADALISGRETEYPRKLKIRRGSTTCQEDDSEVNLVVDFYQRFL